MAKQGTAKTAERVRAKNEAKQNARRSITFYLLRGPTTFQNRGTERNSYACGALAPHPNLVQLKIEREGGDHLHRPATVRKRPHTPLLDGTNRGVRQRRRAIDDFVHLHAAILRGVHLQSHNSLNTGPARKRGASETHRDLRGCRRGKRFPAC